MLKSNNSQEIEREIPGKTVEGMTISEESVVIKFTDGNFIDIDLDKLKKELVTTMNWF